MAFFSRDILPVMSLLGSSYSLPLKVISVCDLDNSIASSASFKATKSIHSSSERNLSLFFSSKAGRPPFFINLSGVTVTIKISPCAFEAQRV